MQSKSVGLPVQTGPSIIKEFQSHLYQNERSVNTIEKYTRDLQALISFLNGRELTKESLLEWKRQLTGAYAPASVNSMLAAVNGFLEWADLPGLRVKPLKIQHEIFARRKRN